MAITDDQRETFLAKLRDGWSLEAAARETGSSRRSFLRLRQKDEAFALAVDDAAEAGVEMLEQKLVRIALGEEKATGPQVTACFGVLGARRPKKWRLQARIEEKPKAPRRRDLKNLSDEELRDLEHLLSKLDRPAES